MKKLLFLLPIFILLAAGCSSSQQSNNQNTTQNTTPVNNFAQQPTATTTATTTTGLDSQKPPIKTATGPDGIILSQEKITWQGQDYTFSLRCIGTKYHIFYLDANYNITASDYCLGTNNVELSAPNKATVVLKTINVSQLEKSVGGIYGFLVPSQDGHSFVILNLSHDLCVTDYYCEQSDAGPTPTPDPNYYMSYNISDGNFRDLKNYPPISNYIYVDSDGYSIWNSSGTKAVFIPTNICGGAGCDIKPLRIYDLITDTFHDSNETGINKQDVAGATPNEYPYWDQVAWVGDNSVSAVLVTTTGAKKTITLSGNIQ